MIPSFLLAKLYVKGSLKNTDTGFEFSMKNIIDAAVLIGVGPITVGDKSYESAAISMTVDEKTVAGADLSRRNPVPVRMGVPMKVVVIGDQLAEGSNKINIVVTTSEIGQIKFDISDNLN